MSHGPSDEAAIRKVKHEFCHAIDALDAERLAAICDDDVRLEVPLHDDPLVGDEAVEAYLEWYGDLEYLERAHNVFTPVIDVDGDAATGTWYYTVWYALADGDLEFGQGTFDDEFVRTETGWKLSSVTARRRITRRLPAERIE